MSVVSEKSKRFAVRIVKIYQYLCIEKKEYVLSKQLLRSGTSVGANIAEANYGISRSDFLSKLYIALKEILPEGVDRTEENYKREILKLRIENERLKKNYTVEKRENGETVFIPLKPKNSK